jgi:hypothetical protein
MTGPELAARITAARAALGDFRHEAQTYIDQDRPAPHWQEWAFRLGGELGALLEALGDQAAADPDAAKLAAIREVLAHFDWEFHDRQLALERIEQILGTGV